MPRTSVYCVVRSREQAEQIVDSLEMEDFNHEDISILMLDQQVGRSGARAKGERSHPREMRHGSGRHARLRRFTIADFGTCLTAGPVALAFAAAAGSAGSGIVEVLTSMGLAQHEARRYEDKAGEGNFFLGVHAEDSDRAAVAQDIFETELAEHISTAVEQVSDSQRGQSQGGFSFDNQTN